MAYLWFQWHTHPFFFFLSCAEQSELIEFSEHIESALRCRCIDNDALEIESFPCPNPPGLAGGKAGGISAEAVTGIGGRPASGLVDWDGGCWMFMLFMCAEVSPAWMDCLRSSSMVCRISVSSPSLRSAVTDSCWRRCVILVRLCSNAATTWA